MTQPLYVNDAPGAHAPSWYAATATPPGPFAPLEGDARADVAIVGGGYTGLSAALHLAQAGATVRLVEAHRTGFGASGRNGGQVASGFSRSQPEIAALHGEDTARALWELAQEAKALVRDLVAAHAPEAGWRDGVAYAGRTDRDTAALRHLVDDLARSYGYDAAEPLDAPAMRDRLGTDRLAGGLIDHGAGHIHPLRYAFGLARAAAGAGATLHERTEVTGIEPGANGVRLATPTGTIRAETVIVATGGYGALIPQAAARALPLNGFVAATEPLGERARTICRGGIAAVDSRFVVRYWRLSEDGRLLFGGGENYRRRFPADIATRVRPALADLYPDLASVPFSHVWGGALSITRSRLPLFLRPEPGVISVSGFSGQGVALATLGGRLAAEAAKGASTGFDRLARIAAPPFPGGRTFRAPILALALNWFALRDRLGI